MSESVVSWLLTDESGNELRMPITDLDRIMAKVQSRSDISPENRIATGGVIKREYLTHDIMTIVGIFDSEHVPPYTDYEKGDRYFNSTDGMLYLRWTNGWINPTTPDIERLFVNSADGKMYRYFDGQFIEINAAPPQDSVTAVDI